MKHSNKSPFAAVALAACLAGASLGAAVAHAAPSADIGVKLGKFFNDDQKAAARRAFSQKYAKAKECPPGLEKGKKGCESPWDRRYWEVGQTLQPAVKAYPVPEVSSQLPAPPQGYEYVRVADDILLISSGTKLVVDMIEHVTG